MDTERALCFCARRDDELSSKMVELYFCAPLIRKRLLNINIQYYFDEAEGMVSYG